MAGLFESLEGFYASKADIEKYVAAAHTPRARRWIRFWGRVERVGIAIGVLSAALMALAILATIAGVILDLVFRIKSPYLEWWVWATPFVVAGLGLVVSVVGGRGVAIASYADGMTTTGVVDQAVEHPGSGDDHTWFEIHISAAEPLRLCRKIQLEGVAYDRRVGERVQFRHNSADPNDVRDIRIVGWPDKHQRKKSRAGLEDE